MTATAPVSAQDPPPEPFTTSVPGDVVGTEPRPIVGKIRLALPVLGHLQFAWRDTDPPAGDHFELLGLSITGLEGGVEIYEWLALEVGAYFWWDSAFSQDFSGRIGIVPVVVNDRNPQGEGWTLQLPVLAGYELYNINSQIEGVSRRWLLHAANFRAGLDGTYWFPSFGLTGRAVASGGSVLGGSSPDGDDSVVPGSSTYDIAGPVAGSDYDAFLGCDISIGLAF